MTRFQRLLVIALMLGLGACSSSSKGEGDQSSAGDALLADVRSDVRLPDSGAPDQGGLQPDGALAPDQAEPQDTGLDAGLNDSVAPDSGTPDVAPPVDITPGPIGSVDVTISLVPHASVVGAGETTVSFALPLPPGLLSDPAKVALFVDGNEVPLYRKSLGPLALDSAGLSALRRFARPRRARDSLPAAAVPRHLQQRRAAPSGSAPRCDRQGPAR